MDLNYLFYRHQVSLMRAAGAASVEARLAHRAFARAYAERIERLRAGLGIPALMMASQ